VLLVVIGYGTNDLDLIVITVRMVQGAVLVEPSLHLRIHGRTEKTPKSLSPHVSQCSFHAIGRPPEGRVKRDAARESGGRQSNPIANGVASCLFQLLCSNDDRS
jgi:hypothetical protein